MSFVQQTEQYYNFKDRTKSEVGNDNRSNFSEKGDISRHKWIYDISDFQKLFSHFQEHDDYYAILAQMGGVEGIASALRTDIHNGVEEDELKDNYGINKRKEVFGSNKLSQTPPKGFLVLCWEELGDFMLRVLIVAGIIALVIGIIHTVKDDGNDWIEGCAILIAVVIVVLVGGTNNWKKEQQFKAMEAESKKKTTIVKRAGKYETISFDDLVVGDIVLVRAGFTVPCDGIFVFGTQNLKVVQASLTGEGKELKRNRFYPLLMKGTNISMGEGHMIACSVGDNSEWGQLLLKLQEERDDTPLQERLDDLSKKIGIIGAAVAVALFVILTIKFIIICSTDIGNVKWGHDNCIWYENILEFFIVGITIIVVAVPEGLPLAVTISLAYSMSKMLQDQNFVRHLSACETMGNATTICSDKTGTLTQNLMSVTSIHLSQNLHINDLPKKEDIGNNLFDLMCRSICCNSKAFVHVNDEGKEVLTGGNQTECAMLQMIINYKQDYKQIRQNNKLIQSFPFDSVVKRSSVLTHNNDDTYTLYVMGAAEKILSISKYWCSEDAKQQSNELEQKTEQAITDAINTMTHRGLRCIGVAFKSFSQDQIPWKTTATSGVVDETQQTQLHHDLNWIMLCGIKDPVRPEVPGAVKTCQNAGIVVRMVTGDHQDTARHIAKECGILTNDEQIVMLGSQFRELTDREKKELLPRLRVLARSKPSDKEKLVDWYKTNNNDCVAVTGDGANDATALKISDVGLAMGIQGTDIAKEASDIIIMDDNFASIEKTVMWGRSVYDNIRKFVQFQLTVNVVALTISLIAAFIPDYQNPLTAVQLLWVNLIMDTMAALALATEMPTTELLTRDPFSRDSPLISKIIWRFVAGHSTYQLIVLIITMAVGPKILPDTGKKYGDRWDEKRQQNIGALTVIFNTFVFMQIFNEINARKINNEWNVCKRFFSNWYFLGVIIITVLCQVLFVVYGGDFTSTKPLNGIEWLYCISFGAGELIVNQFVRLFPIDPNDGKQVVDKSVLFRVDPVFMKQNHEDKKAHTDFTSIEMDGNPTTN